MDSLPEPHCNHHFQPKTSGSPPPSPNLPPARPPAHPPICVLRSTRAGNVTYAAPGGLHDDCVMALVLAGHAGDGAGGVIVPRLVPGTNWRQKLGV